MLPLKIYIKVLFQNCILGKVKNQYQRLVSSRKNLQIQDYLLYRLLSALPCKVLSTAFKRVYCMFVCVCVGVRVCVLVCVCVCVCVCV